MSEIEVGEYIRLDDGTIGKYQKNKNWINVVETNDKYIGFDIENDIVKHSKNIIDLIEVGDIVGVTFWHEPDSFEKFVYDVKDLNEFKEQIEEQIITIDTILTHEQYEQNCYKVGDIE